MALAIDCWLAEHYLCTYITGKVCPSRHLPSEKFNLLLDGLETVQAQEALG